MSLWTSSSKKDEPPKPLSLFAFQALHPLCSKSKQLHARWAERRLPTSSQPLIPRFFSSARSWEAQSHFGEWSHSSPGLGQRRDAGSKEVVQTFIGVFMSSD